MSLELVREVSRENPELLPMNLGRTCMRHTELLIEKLRAHGHEAYLMCKTGNEGGYASPGFTPFAIVGLDGVTPFTCTRLSHDAIWCDGKQFDTLGSANEYDQPIYRIPGSNNVSFDPSSGPQIQASPVWNEIPQEYWRNNNPPLKEGASMPTPPSPPTSTPTPPQGKPSYPGDAPGNALGEALFADYQQAGQQPNPGMGVWFWRTAWDAAIEGLSTDASIQKHRNEWRSILGLPPL